METITMSPEERAEFELFRTEKENKQQLALKIRTQIEQLTTLIKDAENLGLKVDIIKEYLGNRSSQPIGLRITEQITF
ncbi:MAG: hypothetical protein RR328_04560 [Bacteroidales bacterium]